MSSSCSCSIGYQGISKISCIICYLGVKEKDGLQKLKWCQGLCTARLHGGRMERFKEELRLEGLQGAHGASSCSGRGSSKAEPAASCSWRLSRMEMPGAPWTELLSLVLMKITTICHNAMSCHCVPQGLASSSQPSTSPPVSAPCKTRCHPLLVSLGWRCWTQPHYQPPKMFSC